LNLLPFLAVFPLSAAIVWFGVRQALRPAGKVAAEVGRRRHDDLQPLPIEPLPRELRPFAESINGLLDRLATALAVQRRFVGDAAHELRTPLAALQLQLGNLEHAVGEAERRESFEALRGGLARATRLVEQLLALARLDPDAALERTPVDVERVVREVLADLAPLAEAKGIDLGIVESTPVRLTAHAESIRLIVRNLVDNAIRYTPAGGRVDVRLQRTPGILGDGAAPGGGDALTLEIADTGPGIGPSDRERVFDRFYRGDAATDATGSGLGLSIVRQAVEQANGTITLAEGEGGRGLRVTVRLRDQGV
jgi:two-component system OmpR family sensor kinase